MERGTLFVTFSQGKTFITIDFNFKCYIFALKPTKYVKEKIH